MRKGLTLLLYSRYPVLFAEHRFSPAETGMAWGFQHDDGWFGVVDALAAVITAHAPAASAVQVKQDMGALRFTLREGDAFTHGACAAAERFSKGVSEVSGRRGVLMVGRQGRWLKTLAPGEMAGFVPVQPLAEASGEDNSADDEPGAFEESAALAGAAAFQQAMAHRLHPVTGACGPVDDRGELANGAEGG